MDRALAEARAARLAALAAADELQHDLPERISRRRLPPVVREEHHREGIQEPDDRPGGAAQHSGVALQVESAPANPLGHAHASRLLRALHRLVPPELRGNEDFGLALRLHIEAAALESIRAMASDIERYAQFCSSQAATGLPATPTTIVDYLTSLRANGLAFATVNRHVSSIAKIHDIFGLQSPTMSAAVRAKLRGYGKQRGVLQRQAKALRMKGEGGIGSDAGQELCVKNIVAACDSSIGGLRDAALLWTAYDGGLRASELAAIAWEDFRHVRTAADGRDIGEGTLFLPRSKTDQAGAGARIWLSAETVARLDEWKKAGNFATGPIFRRVWKHTEGRRAKRTSPIGGESLSRSGIQHIIIAAIERAVAAGTVVVSPEELEEMLTRVSTHSFRVGVTQDLYAAGADTYAIMQSLRWKNPSTPLRYARELPPMDGATARFLKRPA